MDLPTVTGGTGIATPNQDLPEGVRVFKSGGYYAEHVRVEDWPFRLLRRKDSRNYYLELTLGPPGTMPRPTSTGTADLLEALRIGKERCRDARIKIIRDESLTEPTMRSLVPQFLRWAEEQVTDPKHVKDRIRRFKSITINHLLPLFGSRTLSSLTTKDADHFIRQRKKDGAKQSTIATDLSTLRTWCKFAMDKNWRKEPLRAPIKQQKPNEYNNSWFDEDAGIMLRLILREEDPVLANLCAFLYYTGARVTEASNFTFEDVIPFKPRNAALTIRIKLQGKAKLRTVPVVRVVKTIVDRMAKHHGRTNGPVFPNVKKLSEDFTRILRVWGLYYDELGNTRHLGSLRHTRATIELNREAMTRPMLAAWMGHSVDEQETTYSKVLESMNQSGAYSRKTARAGVNTRKGLRGVDRWRAEIQAQGLRRK